jgi:large subunit ribosomal protein L5
MSTATSARPRLKARYHDEIKPRLQSDLELPNIMQVPTLTKIVVNMGVGDALQSAKVLEGALEDLSTISGQKAVPTRAKKSIAGFKVREGMKLGCMVTLRGARMWDFLDRLLTVALPRTRDFRGISRKAFDGRGNYTLGVKELLIFPEVDIEKLDKVPGMNVCIHTTAKSDDEGRALLQHLGMPFRA